MKLSRLHTAPRPVPGSASRRRPQSSRRTGSVLIIVLWISFGLVALALYFAQSMSLELRAATNRASAVEAGQAIEGAARYVSNLLANAEEPGRLPDLETYAREAVPVGEARFWFVAPVPELDSPTQPFFSLVDEASKLNLNTATQDMLEALPGMTPDLAAAIIDWRDEDSDLTSGGAEEETYLRFNPPYRGKNAPFEFVDELRLVRGADLVLLFGEDTNLNGMLDPNENNGDLSPPSDNRDGRLDPGLLHFLTVHTRGPAGSQTNATGASLINVTTDEGREELATLLQETFDADRANAILSQLEDADEVDSILDLFVRSGMTSEEFARIEGRLTVSDDPPEGLVNVNTASETVLACLPGIGIEKAASVVAYRQANPDQLDSVAWLTEVLGTEDAAEAGPFVTARSHQFTADIAAVGRHGRGYRRVRFVFDISGETPRIAIRRDLTHLGWALGADTRARLELAAQTGRNFR